MPAEHASWRLAQLANRQDELPGSRSHSGFVVLRSHFFSRANLSTAEQFDLDQRSAHSQVWRGHSEAPGSELQ